MRYLISEFTGIGDMIQKTPMIRTIKENDRDSEVFIVGDNRWGAMNLLQDAEYIDGKFNVAEHRSRDF